MMVTNFVLIALLLWAGSVPVVIPKHYGHMNRKFWGQYVCNKYALPVNTMWTLRASCEDTKRFQCQPGYQSRVQTTCRNGLWYTEPTCQGQCMSDPEIINGAINKEITSRDIGQQYNFTCQEPYTEMGTEGVVTCNANGEWGASITCKGEECTKILKNTHIDGNKYYINSYEGSDCVKECGEDPECSYIIPPIGVSYCTMYKQPVIFALEDAPSRQVGLVQCIQKCKELNGCLTMSYSYANQVYECLLFNVTLEEIPSDNIITNDGVIKKDKCL